MTIPIYFHEPSRILMELYNKKEVAVTGAWKEIYLIWGK
jgi:hypothetical protein